jgi:hypothetical protein
LPAGINNESIMTAIQLNAELFKELNIIVTDEGLMEKAIKALRAITSGSKQASNAKVQDTAIDWNNLPELPEEFRKLRGMGHVTDEDIANDERLAYIMSK